MLRLLENHDQAVLTAAVERALALGVRDADAVRLLLLQQAERPTTPFDLSGRPRLMAVSVPAVNLSCYSRLLAGEVGHD